AFVRAEAAVGAIPAVALNATGILGGESGFANDHREAFDQDSHLLPCCKAWHRHRSRILDLHLQTEAAERETYVFCILAHLPHDGTARLDGNDTPTPLQEVVDLLCSEEREPLVHVDANAHLDLTHTKAPVFAPPNGKAHLPGPLQELDVARNQDGGPGQVRRLVRRESALGSICRSSSLTPFPACRLARARAIRWRKRGSCSSL